MYIYEGPAAWCDMLPPPPVLLHGWSMFTCTASHTLQVVCACMRHQGLQLVCAMPVGPCLVPAASSSARKHRM